jgi:hypothetical protein
VPAAAGPVPATGAVPSAATEGLSSGASESPAAAAVAWPATDVAPGEAVATDETREGPA